MSADANLKTIGAAYEAFGRGDVAAILDLVADDVDWAAEAASPTARAGTDPPTAPTMSGSLRSREGREPKGTRLRLPRRPDLADAARR